MKHQHGKSASTAGQARPVTASLPVVGSAEPDFPDPCNGGRAVSSCHYCEGPETD